LQSDTEQALGARFPNAHILKLIDWDKVEELRTTITEEERQRDFRHINMKRKKMEPESGV
jgi:hypothetical protein